MSQTSFYNFHNRKFVKVFSKSLSIRITDMLSIKCIYKDYYFNRFLIYECIDIKPPVICLDIFSQLSQLLKSNPSVFIIKNQ